MHDEFKEVATTSERLVELRNQLNLSQNKFAKKIGVNVSTLSRWEKGQSETIRSSYLKKISDTFNISPMWLFGFDVPMEKEEQQHEALRKSISNRLFDLTNSELNVVSDLVGSFIKNKGNKL